MSRRGIAIGFRALLFATSPACTPFPEYPTFDDADTNPVHPPAMGESLSVTSSDGDTGQAVATGWFASGAGESTGTIETPGGSSTAALGQNPDPTDLPEPPEPPEPPDPVVGFDDPALDGPLVVAGTAYWQDSAAAIPVCWEPGTPDDPARGWIRQAVELGWSRASRITFTGWEECTRGDAPGIHLRNLERAVEDGELSAGTLSNANGYGRVPRSGEDLDGIESGVTLSFCSEVALSEREACVRAIALHVFGHVLGFYHLEERSDAAHPRCSRHPLLEPSPPQYGSYRNTSVMTECGRDRVSLDPLDIVAVQRVYGRKIGGTLLALEGARCLREAASGAVELHPCTEAPTERWHLLDGEGLLGTSMPSSGSNGTCLVLDAAERPALSTCDAAALAFRLHDVELRGMGGKCLDVPDDIHVDGARVQVWECSSDLIPSTYNLRQRWDVTVLAGGLVELRLSAAPEMCVTAPAERSTSDPLFLARCGSGGTQAFEITGDGSLRDPVHSQHCWDVAGPNDLELTHGVGTVHDGARVHLFTCSAPTLNQKWNVSGPIRRADASGQCLEAAGSGTNPSTVRFGPCSSAFDLARDSLQSWAYYFR